MNIEKLFSQEPKIIRRNNAESDKLSLQNQKVVKRKRAKTGEPKIIRRNEMKTAKPEEPESQERRRFLKIAGAVAVAFGTGVGLKEMFENGEDKSSSAKAFSGVEATEDKMADKPADAEAMEDKPEDEVKNGKEENEKETMEINNLADRYLKAYLEISKDPEKFPKEILEKDLLIAQ